MKARSTYSIAAWRRSSATSVHYPPDVTSCIFWLRNRRRKHWLERARPPAEVGLTLAELEEASARARLMHEQSRAR